MRAACRVAVREVHRVGGGDINDAYRVELEDGTRAFVKTRADAAAGEYATEADGLRWLADAGGLPLPQVLGVDDDVLVLEWVDEGTAGDEASLGRGLARIHAAGAPAFGAGGDAASGGGEAPGGGAASSGSAASSGVRRREASLRRAGRARCASRAWSCPTIPRPTGPRSMPATASRRCCTRSRRRRRARLSA